MAWIATEYKTPEGKTIPVVINTDHIRMVKRRDNNDAMVLWAVPNVGALTLNEGYVKFVNRLTP